MSITHTIIQIYVDNIGNAVELYYNDTTTTKYYSLDCCIKKLQEVNSLTCQKHEK
ncbi:hypothetical protein [Finegoldia magna]|uniref:hypothetical protein n=1 Tax=Finegoldia magna TaxID=1260 RepID=UPI00243202BD|nr:hypothetical protein [Finegoldia magna]MDU4209994.1 hypothetical protein [Finegoldia magna]